jgi:hypothetical protein
MLVTMTSSRGTNYDPEEYEQFDTNLVFIIMPFRGVEMADVYRIIQRACKTLKLQAVRVDENPGSGMVIHEINDLIERAEFVICDLTYERPNVYYELGYAHGVGNEGLDILLIAREGTVLHFDISPFRVHYYSSMAQLRIIVLDNLRGMIKRTRS